MSLKRTSAGVLAGRYKKKKKEKRKKEKRKTDLYLASRRQKTAPGAPTPNKKQQTANKKRAQVNGADNRKEENGRQKNRKWGADTRKSGRKNQKPKSP